MFSRVSRRLPIEGVRYESDLAFIPALHLVDGVEYAGTSTLSAVADLLFPEAVKRCSRHEDEHYRVFCEGDTARFTGIRQSSSSAYFERSGRERWDCPDWTIHQVF